MAETRTNRAVRIVRLFFAFVVLFIPFLCWSQHYPILHVPGSPSQVSALLQDHDARLWVGTKEGLFCFDGERFYGSIDWFYSCWGCSPADWTATDVAEP